MDYNSKLWGSSGWTFLEYTALGYPDSPTDKDKEHYKQLFSNLEYTLPCKECRINFSLHILETPIEPYLKNSYSLYEWTIIMKNKINRLLKKPYIDHEKQRSHHFKKNILFTSTKPCCGRGKGKELEPTPTEKKIQIEHLQRNIRSKKNELLKRKENRKNKKRHKK